MDRDPCSRLGSSPRDAEDIKAHAFLKILDWQKVLNREYPVPIPEPKKLDTSIEFSRSIFIELQKAGVRNPSVEDTS